MHEYAFYPLRNAFQQFQVLLGHAGARLDQQQHHIRLAYLPPGACYAHALDFVLGIAQARGVDNVERHAVDVDRLAHAVAGGAWSCGDDGEVLARKTIQQARLAHIGPSCQHHLQAGAQQASLPAFRERGIDGADQLGVASLRIGPVQRVKLLLGKIECRLHQHAQFDQLPQQLLDRCRKLAAERTQRATRGAVGGGLDQVGHAFGLSQVELVVEKRAAGEFARLGQARAQLEAAL